MHIIPAWMDLSENGGQGCRLTTLRLRHSFEPSGIESVAIGFRHGWREGLVDPPVCRYVV